MREQVARAALVHAVAPRSDLELRVLVEALDCYAERNDRATLVHFGISDATAAIRKRITEVFEVPDGSGARLRKELLEE